MVGKSKNWVGTKPTYRYTPPLPPLDEFKALAVKISPEEDTFQSCVN